MAINIKDPLQAMLVVMLGVHMGAMLFLLFAAYGIYTHYAFVLMGNVLKICAELEWDSDKIQHKRRACTLLRSVATVGILGILVSLASLAVDAAAILGILWKDMKLAKLAAAGFHAFGAAFALVAMALLANNAAETETPAHAMAYARTDDEKRALVYAEQMHIQYAMAAWCHAMLMVLSGLIAALALFSSVAARNAGGQAPQTGD